MKSASMILGITCLLLATGCSNTRTVSVEVPPRMDLRNYTTVGLVGFSSNARGDLDRMSTQRFLRAVQSAQPGTRVVELGSERDVLASVGRRSWDRETFRLVSEEHGVDALVLGRLNVEREKPDVKFSTFVKSLHVKQDVNAELTARVVEASSGATMWSDGAQCTHNLSHAGISGRDAHFGANDPEAVYGEMVDGLVWEITDAFRPHFVTRRVPKNEAVASVE
jgi:hypothetical protein